MLGEHNKQITKQVAPYTYNLQIGHLKVSYVLGSQVLLKHLFKDIFAKDTKNSCYT